MYNLFFWIFPFLSFNPVAADIHPGIQAWQNRIETKFLKNTPTAKDVETEVGYLTKKENIDEKTQATEEDRDAVDNTLRILNFFSKQLSASPTFHEGINKDFVERAFHKHSTEFSERFARKTKKGNPTKKFLFFQKYMNSFLKDPLYPEKKAHIALKKFKVNEGSEAHDYFESEDLNSFHPETWKDVVEKDLRSPELYQIYNFSRHVKSLFPYKKASDFISIGSLNNLNDELLAVFLGFSAPLITGPKTTRFLPQFGWEQYKTRISELRQRISSLEPYLEKQYKTLENGLAGFDKTQTQHRLDEENDLLGLKIFRSDHDYSDAGLYFFDGVALDFMEFKKYEGLFFDYTTPFPENPEAFLGVVQDAAEAFMKGANRYARVITSNRTGTLGLGHYYALIIDYDGKDMTIGVTDSMNSSTQGKQLANDIEKYFKEWMTPRGYNVDSITSGYITPIKKQTGGATCGICATLLVEEIIKSKEPLAGWIKKSTSPTKFTNKEEQGFALEILTALNKLNPLIVR